MLYTCFFSSFTCARVILTCNRGGCYGSCCCRTSIRHTADRFENMRDATAHYRALCKYIHSKMVSSNNVATWLHTHTRARTQGVYSECKLTSYSKPFNKKGLKGSCHARTIIAVHLSTRSFSSVAAACCCAHETAQLYHALLRYIIRERTSSSHIIYYFMRFSIIYIL